MSMNMIEKLEEARFEDDEFPEGEFPEDEFPEEDSKLSFATFSAIIPSALKSVPWTRSKLVLEEQFPVAGLSIPLGSPFTFPPSILIGVPLRAPVKVHVAPLVTIAANDVIVVASSPSICVEGMAVFTPNFERLEVTGSNSKRSVVIAMQSTVLADPFLQDWMPFPFIPPVIFGKWCLLLLLEETVAIPAGGSCSCLSETLGCIALFPA
ncbi:hypothetical protein PENSOL_c018G03777 [Penicillium solitum]|uniref:Uncharacterized protein n=1 Tax=Penicillium solitum TaxID=60172 RepID=A0A1V6R312_9EURO|nr:uncharacterized protein PENSOL_c018G03777 [Penicillium solitum]OQD95815.1 hypothetical protein PENSOL_c018G03777 [Penicillium solitum]